jgi:hypothetical protein
MSEGTVIGRYAGKVSIMLFRRLGTELPRLLLLPLKNCFP